MEFMDGLGVETEKRRMTYDVRLKKRRVETFDVGKEGLEKLLFCH